MPVPNGRAAPSPDQNIFDCRWPILDDRWILRKSNVDNRQSTIIFPAQGAALGALAFTSKNDIRVKKRTFDIIIILLIAILLVTLNQFELLEKSAKFMFIPVLAFYFIGQFAERKFQK